MRSDQNSKRRKQRQKLEEEEALLHRGKRGPNGAKMEGAMLVKEMRCWCRRAEHDLETASSST